MPDLTSYIVFLAPYSQHWGGYTYQKGTPLGVGLHVRRDGVDTLYVKCCTIVDIYTGDEATERLKILPSLVQTFSSAEEAEAALPPVLGGSYLNGGYIMRASGTFSPWYFNGKIITPENILTARVS